MKLEYFYFDACPFCQRVLSVIQEHKIDVTYCDILKEQQHLDKLVKDTGRRTVPCLYIDGNPMHESADIINWLQENLDKLPKTS